MSMERARQNADRLIRRFDHYVRAFEANTPFDNKQLRWHLDTLSLRGSFDTPSRALADQQFVRSLWYTLDAWDMNARGAKLRPISEFGPSLLSLGPQVDALAGARLDSPDLNATETADLVWTLMSGLNLGVQKSKLVLGTKTLHHVLPDLVVPMDHQHTRRFFDWSTQFQSREPAVWKYSFEWMAEIARAANPQRFVGQGSRWNTTPAKVIDNAIIGFVRSELGE